MFRRHLTSCYASYILNDFTRGVRHVYSLLRGCITGIFLLVWSFCLKATRPAPVPIPKFLYVGYPVTSGPRWLQFELPSDIIALAVGRDGFTWKVIILEAYNDLSIQWLHRKKAIRCHCQRYIRISSQSSNATPRIHCTCLTLTESPRRHSNSLHSARYTTDHSDDASLSQEAKVYVANTCKIKVQRRESLLWK